MKIAKAQAKSEDNPKSKSEDFSQASIVRDLIIELGWVKLSMLLRRS